MNNRYEVVNVALSELREHPANNTYKTPISEDSEEFKLMAASIASDGLRIPLLVQKNTNTILSGHTRFKIAKSLEWTEIPVMYQDVDDEQGEDILVQDNLERASKEKDLIKLAKSIERLTRKYANRKEAYAQLSNIFNVQDRQLDRLRSLLRLIPELQRLVSEEHIGLKSGAALAGLDVDQQHEVITYIAATGMAESKDWKLTEKEAIHIAGKIRNKLIEPDQAPDELDDESENTLLDPSAGLQHDLEPLDKVEVPGFTYEPQTREEETSAKTEQTIFKALTLLKRDTRAIERIISQTAPLTQGALEMNSIEVKRELSLLKKSLREAINAL